LGRPAVPADRPICLADRATAQARPARLPVRASPADLADLACLAHRPAQAGPLPGRSPGPGLRELAVLHYPLIGPPQCHCRCPALPPLRRTQRYRRYGERSGELMTGDHLMLSPHWAKSSTPTAQLWRYPAEKMLNKQAKGVGLSGLSTNCRTYYKYVRTAVCPLPIVGQRDSSISHEGTLQRSGAGLARLKVGSARLQHSRAIMPYEIKFAPNPAGLQGDTGSCRQRITRHARHFERRARWIRRRTWTATHGRIR
jgi:hypothetical protein